MLRHLPPGVVFVGAMRADSTLHRPRTRSCRSPVTGRLLTQVQCFLDEGNSKSVASLTKGSKVTIRGRVQGLMMNVLVKDCEVVEL